MAESKSSLIALLMPFAAHQASLPPLSKMTGNVRNLQNFWLALGSNASLWEYFPMPCEGNEFFNLWAYWDALLAHRPPAPRRDGPKPSRRQPVWGISDDARRERVRRAHGNSCDCGNALTKFCTLTPAGWYNPAHMATRDAPYGIHLSQSGLVHAAHQVHAYCPEQPQEVVLAAVCHFVYCHQAFHARIEDLCAIIDFGCATKPDSRHGNYVNAHLRFGDLLVMEEMVCNFAALLAVRRCLDVSDPAILQSRSIPTFEPPRIVDALARCLRKQDNLGGDGVEITSPEQLRHHTGRLLREVYGYERIVPNVENIVGDFLAIQTAKAQARGRRPAAPEWAQWDHYPVHIHRL